MLSIDERPDEVADRQVPGHWEGDLMIGKGAHSAVGTLVERTSRFTMLVPLPGPRTAEACRAAVAAAITGLPESLRKSLTWDQGTEMAQHRQFTVDTGVTVYFAHHIRDRRGSVEPMRTPTVCSASTFPTASRLQATRSRSTPSPPYSTVGRDVHSAGEHRPRLSASSWTTLLHRPFETSESMSRASPHHPSARTSTRPASEKSTTFLTFPLHGCGGAMGL
jgi:hypothetical protein